MADETVVTRRDLAEQNIEKVFPSGFASDRETVAMTAETPGSEVVPTTTAVAMRPDFGISAAEADAAKMMSMCGPLIPDWLRANPGHCWGIIQLSKRWTKYDRRTNSWIHFDPITIAQASYLVKSSDGTESVAYMSVFIRALIDAFVPLEGGLHYDYDGEGETRRCIVYGLLRGQKEIQQYQTPELRKIHPKKSPLWASDPDRQLAYYGSRAWARLYAAGVLHGVYDEDELEGERVSVATTNVLAAPTALSGLQERLKRAKAEADPDRNGFHDRVVEDGLQSDKASSGPGKPTGAKKTEAAVGQRGKGKNAQPASAASAHSDQDAPEDDTPPVGEPVDEGEEGDQENVSREKRAAPKTKPGKTAEAKGGVKQKGGAQPPEDEDRAPAKQPEPPKTLAQYKQHVRRWLMELTTEQAIEERFASERALRNRCGVTAEDRAAIRADYVDPRIQELRGADDE